MGNQFVNPEASCDRITHFAHAAVCVTPGGPVWPMLISLFPWSACVSYRAQEDTKRTTGEKPVGRVPCTPFVATTADPVGVSSVVRTQLFAWNVAVWLECELARPKCKLDGFLLANGAWINSSPLAAQGSLLYPFHTCVAQHRATQPAWVLMAGRQKVCYSSVTFHLEPCNTEHTTGERKAALCDVCAVGTHAHTGPPSQNAGKLPGGEGLSRGAKKNVLCVRLFGRKMSDPQRVSENWSEGWCVRVLCRRGRRVRKKKRGHGNPHQVPRGLVAIPSRPKREIECMLFSLEPWASPP